MTKVKKSIVSMAVWGSAFVAGYFGYTYSQDNQFARAQERREEIREGLASAEGLGTVFRNVGRILEPSVVNISVRKKAPVPNMGRGLDEEMLRRMFPDRDGDGEPDIPPGLRPRIPGGPGGPGGGDDDEDGGFFDQQGTGSGVIIQVDGSKGYVVTNNHVAGGATDMVVTLADGREIKNGKLLGADAKTDLALIEIKADRLVAAKWGDSDQLQKGDWIVAFGSPFGYVGSMTHGIVSALNRQAGILGQGGYENFIQVDAPINPGNSGGPLVNLKGEVVGINTAIASRSGGFQGIGFTIPSNQAKFIVQQLKEKGKVTRGWLGVEITDVSKNLQMAESFGYTDTKGVLVNRILPGTPAAGKMKHGDIITAVNGKPVDSVQQLRNAIAAMPPKEEIKISFFRGQKTEETTITLGEQPDNVLAVRPNREAPAADPATTDALGLQLQTLTEELAAKHNVDVKSGVLITKVERNSAAAREGLRVGDVITEVGDTVVKNVEEFNAALKKADLKKGVRLYVTNELGARFVLVQPEQR
jgi:serine protease Do